MHIMMKGTLVAAGALLLAGSALAQDGGRPITVTLSGAEEVAAADPDGSGTFSAQINPGQRQVCYQLSVADIDPAVAAHIHRAPAGVAGPVVVPLAAPTSGSSFGCATITRELAKDLIQNPEAYYVNVHNVAFPGGAIRARLSK